MPRRTPGGRKTAVADVEDKLKREEGLKKRLQAKIEVARFLQVRGRREGVRVIASPQFPFPLFLP